MTVKGIREETVNSPEEVRRGKGRGGEEKGYNRAFKCIDDGVIGSTIRRLVLRQLRADEYVWFVLCLCASASGPVVDRCGRG